MNLLKLLVLTVALADCWNLQAQESLLTQLLEIPADSELHTQDGLTCASIIAQQALYECSQGNLELFDGIPGDNQCHIAAHIVIGLSKDITLTTCKKAQLLEQQLDHDVRYLTLQLLCSSTFYDINKKSLLIKRIEKTQARSQMNKITSKQRQKLTEFLQNPRLMAQAKRCLIAMTLAQINELALDIKQLGTINPCMISSIATYPKFAGIRLLQLLHKVNPQVYVWKIKCLCNHGSHSYVYVEDTLGITAQTAAYTLPVIVIEAIASKHDEMQNFADYNALRKVCNESLFNHKKTAGHRCVLCSVCTDEQCMSLIEETKHRLSQLDLDGVRLAIAASFMHTLQPQCETEVLCAPELANLYQEHLARAETSGMDTNSISTLFIEHMYASQYDRAVSSKRLVNSTTEEICAQLHS